jgi:hypothetical protein
VAIKDFIISKNIKRIKRQIQFHNFDTAQSIGILYKINDKTDFSIVKTFQDELSNLNKKVNSLAYVKKTDEIGTIYFGQGNTNFFSDKHISKLGQIKEICITDFVKHDFDILINLSNDSDFYTEYVFAISKSKFKVSGIIDCKYSDLNINIEKISDMSHFISQIKHYLQTIKKA